jgi:hypothetical protein
VVIGLLVSDVDAGGRRMPVASETSGDRIPPWDEVVAVPVLGVDAGGRTGLETPEVIGGKVPP